MTTPEQPNQNRQIRVFISSTFRDMQKERELLVKKVFPELRRVCDERFVSFTEVDLRWGITQEQQAEGKVLPICLEEIHACRPYFIGILGEYYGWIPNSAPPEVLANEPWIQEQIGQRTSVTELEILHGVLRNPEMAGHAFFYFRDPAYIVTLPDKKQREMVERDIPDDIKEFGPEEAARRTQHRKDKLAALKESICKSGLPLVDPYANPEALAAAVRKQFLDLIDKLYPKKEVPDPLDQEAIGHRTYAQRKLLACIDRPSHLAALDAFADGPPDSRGFVVTGDSGGGKTALLAAWVSRHRQAHPGDFVLEHYFGATSESASVPRFMHRLLGELKRQANIPDEIPSAPEKMVEALPLWLAQTVGKIPRIILVLDALNQIEGASSDCNLSWLPRFFPVHVRVIASSLPGPALNALRPRSWTEHPLPLADADERGRMIDTFLGVYRKELSRTLRDQIVNAPGAANPLFLRTVLEELRQFGDFGHLPDKVRDYFQATTPVDLFRQVIRRWQADFHAGRDVVGRSLRHLWAARQGLGESEWLDLLADDQGPMDRQTWRPLFLALATHLVQRSGLWALGHDYLKQAIQAELLPTEDAQKRAHLAVADHFSAAALSDRKVTELPWQQWQGGDDDGLLSSMCDVPLLVTAVRLGRLADLGDYWKHLQPKHDVVRTYVGLASTVQATPGEAKTYGEYVEAVAVVLEQLGLYEDAENFFGERLRVAMRSGEPLAKLVAATNRLVEILRLQNKYESAMKWLAGVYDVFLDDEQIQDSTIAEYLVVQATVYTEKGYFEEADNVLKPAETWIQPNRNLPAPTVGAVLQARATLAVMAAEQGTDLGFFSESEAHGGDPEIAATRAHDFLREKLGCDHINTAVAQRDVARAYLMARKQQLALDAAAASVKSLETLLGADHPEVAKSLVCLADACFEEGSFERAEPLYKRAVLVFQSRSPENVNYARALSRLASICRAKEQGPEAERLEAVADDVRSAVKAKWGTMRPGLVASRTASRVAALQKTVKSGFSGFGRRLKAWITRLAPRGQKALELTVPVIAIASFTSLALFAFGPFARFLNAQDALAPFRLVGSALGHLAFLLALMLGYAQLFESLFGDKESAPLRGCVIKFIGWGAYASAFFLLRDRWNLIPSTVTSTVVLAMGALLVTFSIVPALIGLVSSRVSAAVDEGIGRWLLRAIFRLVPKTWRHAATLRALGPRAETASASEAVNALVGSGEAAATIRLEPPDGLSVYARAEDLPAPITAPGTLVKHKSRFDAWLAVRAGLVAPLVMVVSELAAFLPAGFRPQRQTAIKYGVLALLVYYVPLGVRMVGRSLPLGKTLAVELPVAVGAALTVAAVGKGLDQSSLSGSLDWILKANVTLVLTYGIARAIVGHVARFGIPQPVVQEAERLRFSVVFGIISGLVAPAFILTARLGARLVRPQGSAAVWVPATVFGLCIFAFIALGFEISRRRLHLLKTLAIQCPLCFVAITGLLLSLSDKGSDKAIAGGVVFVGLASLIEAVSWGISRRVLRRLKG